MTDPSATPATPATPATGATPAGPALPAQLDFEFTLLTLSRASRADRADLLAWINEGVLTPVSPFSADDDSWRFGADCLARACAAQRLTRDLAINAAGVALVLDLLDHIADLQSRLRHASGG